MLGGYEVVVLTATTDGSGAATVTSDVSYTGRVIQVDYLEVSGSEFSDGVLADFHAVADGSFVRDFKFHDTASGTLNASATILPSYTVYDSAGADSGSDDFYCLVDEKIKVVIASGGSAKTGKFRFKLKS